MPTIKTENPRRNATLKLRTAPAITARQGKLTAGSVRSKLAATPESPLFTIAAASGISVQVGTMSTVPKADARITPITLFWASGNASMR